MDKYGNLALVQDEIKKCIKCGNCQAVCPVFGETRTESGVARGKIRLANAILKNEVEINPEIGKRLDLCLACGACSSNCPSGVKYQEIILAARDEIAKNSKPSLKKLVSEPWKSPIVYKIMGNRKLLHFFLKSAGKASKPFFKGPVMRHLPLALSELTSYRSLPVIADKPFRDRYQEYQQNIPELKGNVVFYSGCAIDFAYPQIGMSLIKVLNKRGYKVLYPMEQGCCGIALRYMGDIELVRKMAKDNIVAMEKALKEEQADCIVMACATCTSSWVHDYPELLKDEPEWMKRAEQLKDKIVEFTCFISRESEKETKSGKKPGSEKGKALKVTYHDSCHMKRHLGIFKEPRELLSSMPGVEYVEMPKADACCGCGGTFSVKFPEVAAGILGKKLANIESTKADMVVTGCPGCLMQIKGGLDKAGSSVQAKHIAELLAEQEGL